MSTTLYTIGHSNHPFDTFLDLLRLHRIDVLADVRTQPFSQFSPQFNRENLRSAIVSASLQYVFLGDSLGGRPDGDDLYDDRGHVLYYRVAQSERFNRGIDRLLSGMEKYRVAIMCSEEDPAVCHRFLLVTRVLDQRGIDIQHIRGDGQLQSERTVCQSSKDRRNQGVLFEEMENDTWKSLRSVLLKAQPNDSLGD